MNSPFNPSSFSPDARFCCFARMPNGAITTLPTAVSPKEAAIFDSLMTTLGAVVIRIELVEQKESS